MDLELRKKSHEQFRSIWKAAQTGDLDSLSDEQRSLAGIMIEHEQYHDQFEIANMFYDYDYDAGSKTNPFLHITLHQVIQDQLEQREPIEALQFYNSMRRHKVSRHEAIHCIAAILSFLFYDLSARKEEFDNEKYRSLLRKYKNKKPEKLMDALEKEFAFDYGPG